VGTLADVGLVERQEAMVREVFGGVVGEWIEIWVLWG